MEKEEEEEKGDENWELGFWIEDEKKREGGVRVLRKRE